MAVSAKTLGLTPEPCEEGIIASRSRLYSGHGRAGRVCSDGDLNVRRVKPQPVFARILTDKPRYSAYGVAQASWGCISRGLVGTGEALLDERTGTVVHDLRGEVRHFDRFMRSL
jgi:hypothetical protein